MSTNRRGFIGRIAVALAAPVIPIAAVATPVIAKNLYACGADFDGNTDLGSFARSQPTAKGGELTKEFVGRGMTKPVFLYEEDVILAHWKPTTIPIPKELLQ